MTIDPSEQGIFDAVASSNPRSDWNVVSKPDREIRYFRGDVNLRFESGHVCAEEFETEWTKGKFPGPARSDFYNLYYGSTLVYQFVLVSVDGARAILPLPSDLENLIVEPLNYKVAQIYDSLNSLDHYMGVCRLKVADAAS
ncbi:MAG: hypothetical protein MPJ79_01995 [Alphaproteobacteria bacterium]|nr:hypothetical protein [Alphaproteobacteria bacterium]MDA8009449.1 hypothetical protein [Alphaproteobacteria bacterium]